MTHAIVNMAKRNLPETTAHVRVTQHSWQFGKVVGEVTAGDFCWEFQWCCREGKIELIVEPALGRSLIQDALGRFLKRWDYQLEAGGDYEFTVRAKF
jgi:Protein of unknown function (DUF3146)